MNRYKKILVLENEIEASLMRKLLDETKIPYLLKSYYDSALDGLYQTQKGYGHIEAPEDYRNTILNLYKDAVGTSDQ